jgi:hydrogenase nickel incorporation protein HypA/HybF
MHERSVLDALMRKVATEVALTGATRARALTVRLGALSHFSPEHFREHFQAASQGTVADGARLTIEVGTDPGDPDAQGVLLVSMQLELPG